MHPKSLETLVKNIEKKLHDQDRRPAWLVKKSGIPAGNISRILKKETSPSLGTLETIADAFECTVAELLMDEQPPVPLSLVGKLGKLTEPDLRVIEQFADQILLRIAAEKKSQSKV